MKLGVKSKVKLKLFKINQELYNQLLTEMAEIIYDLICPSKISVSTAKGGGKASELEPCPTNLNSEFTEVKSG